MAKHAVSHAKQHQRALEDPDTGALLEKLIAEWGDLNLVQRGERLKALKDRDCTEPGLEKVLSDRGLGKALDVDPGIISRDLRIAQLPSKQRAKIARGESAVPFLRRQQELKERGAKADRVNLVHKRRPQPGKDAKILPLENQIEPLINSVQQLEKRISTIEKKVSNVPLPGQAQPSSSDQPLEKGQARCAPPNKIVSGPASVESSQPTLQDKMWAREEQKLKDYYDRRKTLEESCRPRRIWGL